MRWMPEASSFDHRARTVAILRAMRTSLFLVAVLGTGSLIAQTFTEVPSGQVRVGELLVNQDSCTIDVAAFAISAPVTVEEYRAFVEHFAKGGEARQGGTGDAAVNLTWVEAAAYCQWLSQRDAAQGFSYRLPALGEWLLARKQGLIPADGPGCWLITAKDDSGLTCQRFGYAYPCTEGDPFARRRKMVAFGDPTAHPSYGVHEDRWDFIAYPDIGFRVVREAVRR